MILLDTHVWIRWLAPENGPLPIKLQQSIESSTRLAVSVVSCWELAYLARLGKIDLGIPIASWLQAALEESGIECLTLTCETALVAAELPLVHRDPADRFIIATACQLQCRLLSLDRKFRDYRELDSLLLTD